MKPTGAGAAAPAPAYVKPQWRTTTPAPTVAQGFASYQAPSGNEKGIEHRAAGQRAAALKPDAQYPAAKYAAEEMWKLRTVQWVPTPTKPRDEDVTSLVQAWFPKFTKDLSDRESLLAAREQAVEEREQALARREAVLAARLHAFVDLADRYAGTWDELRAALDNRQQMENEADAMALHREALGLWTDMTNALLVQQRIVLNLLVAQDPDPKDLRDAMAGFAAFARDLAEQLPHLIEQAAVVIAQARAERDEEEAQAAVEEREHEDPGAEAEEEDEEGVAATPMEIAVTSSNDSVAAVPQVGASLKRSRGVRDEDQPKGGQ